jgi:hypothetical protein
MSATACKGGSRSLLSHAVVVATVVGWASFGFAQAIDGSRPSLPDNPSNRLCEGLPLNSAWAALTGGATAAAETKKCAATILVGKQLDTGQQNVFGLGAFVPPYAYKYGNSYFVGGSLSRVIGELGEFVAYEVEPGIGQRFGSLHEEEVWIALYARWKYFPWNDYVRTTIAASTGVSYASAIPAYEVIHSGNNQGSRLLHYFSPEITFAQPSQPDSELVIRIQHRSGGGLFFGDHFPVYGGSFHGVLGGVQYLTAGFRQHF